MVFRKYCDEYFLLGGSIFLHANESAIAQMKAEYWKKCSPLTD